MHALNQEALPNTVVSQHTSGSWPGELKSCGRKTGDPEEEGGEERKKMRWLGVFGKYVEGHSKKERRASGNPSTMRGLPSNLLMGVACPGRHIPGWRDLSAV